MYRAPVAEIAFTLKHVAGLKQALEDGRLGDLSEDLADAILEEAGRFATEEVAPLNAIGDEKGAVLKDAAVTMPPGWKELYARWIAGGWSSVTGPEESTALSKALRKRGWSFVGPTTVYAFMQGVGLVNDHIEGCMCRDAVEAERQAFKRPA